MLGIYSSGTHCGQQHWHLFMTVTDWRKLSAWLALFGFILALFSYLVEVFFAQSKLGNLFR
jgi:hypothetical protein